MEGKKSFSVKKGSVLPYVAAALGGIMLILSFFILTSGEGSESLNGFTMPVLRWFPYGFDYWWFSWNLCCLDLLLLLTAVTLLLAGRRTKRNPLFCALPSTFFMIFLLVWTIDIGRGAFKGWNIPFLLLSLAVCILSLLTTRGVVKTKLPLVIESFLAALLSLLLLVVVGDWPGYCTPFLYGYGFRSTFSDYLVLVRFCCLFLGTGLLALSLEYTEVPQNQAGAGEYATSQPQHSRPRLTGLSPTLAERRSIAVCILLSFLTFGFYLIYWKYTLCKKVRAWCGEPEDCGGETVCLVLVPFYSLYWLYTRGVKMFEASLKHDFLVPDHAVLYLLLDLFGLGLVAYGLMQNEFNKIADCCDGREAPGAFPVQNGPASAPVSAEPAVAQEEAPSAPAVSPVEKTEEQRLKEAQSLLHKRLITQEEAPSAPAASPVEKTVEQRLEEAKSLLHKGLITQEEFEEKWREILEKL